MFPKEKYGGCGKPIENAWALWTPEEGFSKVIAYLQLFGSLHDLSEIGTQENETVMSAKENILNNTSSS